MSALERRLRQFRSRVLIRQWNYRQRRHARGSWFQLRRVLADAAEAYVVPGPDMNRLLEEGYRAEPVGDAFEPPKVIVFVPRERIASIAAARPIPVRLEGDLLAAEHLALVRFDERS